MTRTPLMQAVADNLRPDPARVIAKLFLPGEEEHGTQSRAAAIVARVMALPETEIEELAAALLRDFTGRHRNYADVLDRHASIVSSRLSERPPLSVARTQVLGAAFTSEYSTEAAALLNPSAVLSPDQSGVLPGQIRSAVSLRAIGEGHLSSIGFCSALVGPGPTWSFEPRARPAVTGATSDARWTIEDLRSVLRDQGQLDELGRSLLDALPDSFDNADVERAILGLHPELTSRAGGGTSVDLVRRTVDSAYTATFDNDVALSQRVLHPSAAEESNGMEDARFTRFVDDDGAVEFRGTYTAYDGRRIAPRLLVSADLRTFRAYRLAGGAARNKGMALFPRTIAGRHAALCRTDGESTSLAFSDDGRTWGEPVVLHQPATRWELLQVGNCGPPIETDRGWLVLTHAVGAMRVYTIGAILLDLDDPSKVIGQLDEPLLVPEAADRDGYVPNVVYSCGGLVHDDRLWLPYGVNDARVGVAWAPLPELLDRLLAADQRARVPLSTSRS
ncbi:glycoside hydrolase family 130 protein [uncultured Jatrophihabitans sp.]|uniref:glycoside hydrolase family 130 protein n=1 Tax=uncultured Jatrophihabitans sp. TaxID=1610747 RepID=UPI0035C9EE39